MHLLNAIENEIATANSTTYDQWHSQHCIFAHRDHSLSVNKKQSM